MKKRIKISKKRIMCKVVLIYNYNKVYAIEHWYKKDISICKIDYFFNVVVII